MPRPTLAAKILVGLCVAAPALAQTDTERFFGRGSPALSTTEQRGVSISNQFLDRGPAAVQPVPANGGAVSFPFGATAPSIVCAPLQICNIELEPGEQVNDVMLGDSARWLVEPAVSGSADGPIQHLVVKPLAVGLETTLAVFTDRRTYHMRLRSHRSDFMARVAFAYPEDANAKARAGFRRAALARASAPAAGPTGAGAAGGQGDYLNRLSFNYAIDGNAPWRPVRVFNDGVKTIVEMPAAMQQTEAPSLLVVRRDGDPKDDADKVLVNYRLQDNRFIVDAVFDKAVLVAGVGRRQDRVVITRR